MLFKTTLILLMWSQMVYSGIIGVYHELSDTLQINLKILVQNGKYSVFSSVLNDYELESSQEVVLTLWDYICALNVGNDNICAVIGSSAADSVPGNAAFAQLEMYGGTTFTGYWDTIPFSLIKFNKLITFNPSSAEVMFSIKGIYKCTIGYRGGQGSDQWNSIRVLGLSSGTVGISNGAGLETEGNGGDSTQHSFSFFFEIDDLSDGYVIQHGRHDAVYVAIPDTATWGDGSEAPPTLVSLIEFVGSV